MKIVLTLQESEEIFHAALCNAESTIETFSLVNIIKP